MRIPIQLRLASITAPYFSTPRPSTAAQRVFQLARLDKYHATGRVRIQPTAMQQHANFSAGHGDPAPLEAALATLLSSSGTGGRWTLAGDGESLERTFKFKTFAKTWDFMTAVSLQCKLKNHHPEWSNVFNTTFIRWTTHNPKGLSAKDLELAAVCDTLARDFGEIEDQTKACELQDLANKAVSSSGDCCTPKK